jgi:hypothetical protein
MTAVKVVDMTLSNLSAECAAIYLSTRAAHGEHELAKAELKKLMPDDEGSHRPRPSRQGRQIRRDQL